ncbi:TerC family protein [Kitasatospora acidiphila]|uniref:TerC family protein n=1 Tax=Kitasatospora acidiphila TaxID=2567942 RepID=A0A540W266_9ACTN|nr:TerC family protein [Kitasatospora acidiphila]TQF03120.1 TerC family protein [Kitasatospora acidiphila]
MDVSVALWASTVAVLVVLIAADFIINARRPHVVSMKEAGIWTGVWIALAALFGLFLWWHSGAKPAGEFFAGYLTEKSLSVDNLFVFLLIMKKFAVPAREQSRVLSVGVIIALVLRAIFIALGAALIAAFSWVFYLFGAFLLWTAWKLFAEARAGRPEDEEFHENRMLVAIRKRFPSVSKSAVVMLAIGTTDLLFALDSIPAIFGLTQSAYIVLTANAFALMGLRQLYFLLGGMLGRLVHLGYGLALILGFVGVKLVLHALHESGVHVPQIGIPLSLGFIAAVLVATTASSLWVSRRSRATG